MPEGSNGLRLVILEDIEGGLWQVCDQMILIVHDGCVHDDFFDLGLKDENTTFFRRLLPGLLLILGLLPFTLLTRRRGRLARRRLALSRLTGRARTG